MNLYIDADSLLYRAAHLCTVKEDESMNEALQLEYGKYLVVTVAGGTMEQPDITEEYPEYIIANSKAEAEEIYKRKNKVDYWDARAELVESLDDDDDIGLAEVEETALIDSMAKIFHSMSAEIEAEVRSEYPIETTYHVLTVKGKHECCKDLSDNFRYEVMQSVEDEKVKGYKENRAGMEVPSGLDEIYEYVFNLETTICESGVEADDVVVHYGRRGHLVAALDKDVIGSLAVAYNYGKKEWVTNLERDIVRFPYIQTITGDTSDGLRGVFRVGIKGAEKALDGIEDEDKLWRAVVKQYALKDQSIEEAIATMRCVNMGQWTPEGGLELWQPKR